MSGKSSKQPAAKAPQIEQEESDSKTVDITALADLANRYPFRWFSSGVVGKMCGFGKDVMAELAELGAPIVARKSNPHLLHLWLTQNLDKIGKIRGDS